MQPELIEEAENESGTGRSMDAEIKVMGKIIRILDDLDEPAKTRIMAYLAARYKE